MSLYLSSTLDVLADHERHEIGRVRDRHLVVPGHGSVAVVGLLDKLAVADHGLALLGGDVLLGRRLVAWEIERRKPVSSLLGLALRPDLCRMRLAVVRLPSTK